MPGSIHNGNRTDIKTKILISALISAGYTKQDVAKQLHVSEKTVTAVCNSDAANAPPPALVADIKKQLGDRFARQADTFLNSIDNAKLGKMSAYQAIVAAGIAVDKMLLLDGKPTQIHAVALFQQVQADQAALRNELDYMRDAIDVTPDGCI